MIDFLDDSAAVLAACPLSLQALLSIASDKTHFQAWRSILDGLEVYTVAGVVDIRDSYSPTFG